MRALWSVTPTLMDRNSWLRILTEFFRAWSGTALTDRVSPASGLGTKYNFLSHAISFFSPVFLLLQNLSSLVLLELSIGAFLI